MNYNITEILSGKLFKDEKRTWRETESKMGIVFPEDYKRFIEQYGAGAINGFLWILSPFCENKNINLPEKFKVMQASYISIKKEFPDKFWYDFYEAGKGLFPWGITDNGDELFWCFGESRTEIVVFASRYAERVSYPMNMEEFLYKILTKEIVCSIFPDDFVLDKNNYEHV